MLSLLPWQKKKRYKVPWRKFPRILKVNPEQGSNLKKKLNEWNDPSINGIISAFNKPSRDGAGRGQSPGGIDQNRVVIVAAVMAVVAAVGVVDDVAVDGPMIMNWRNCAGDWVSGWPSAIWTRLTGPTLAISPNAINWMRSTAAISTASSGNATPASSNWNVKSFPFSLLLLLPPPPTLNPFKFKRKRKNSTKIFI